MLQMDSIVTDLMFDATAAIDQQQLIDGLGGEDFLATRQLLDVDRLDPRAEMELSPSMPFRRRGERRLMMVDDQVTPRADPAADPFIKTDLRPYKEALIGICELLPVRLGRLFALGSWGDAVIVTRSARDLRGIALLPWVLDPQVDLDGKRRATPLSQKEFEAKVMAYDKRLDELDEQQILEGLANVTFERRGELFVVDVLEADGTWDQRKSAVMELELGAIERFSLLPGAPSTTPAKGKLVGANGAAAKSAKPAASAAPAQAEAEAAKPAPAPAPPPAPKIETGPPLSASMVDGGVVLVFPAERFDLDVAAALGKRDWDQVVRSSDKMSGEMRDKMHRSGAAWIAPLEFLSEVFVDGKPLTKADFEKTATPAGDGVRALEVHFPRFGPVMLLDVAGKGRFVTSLTDQVERAVALV
jgi:hypothetical protein